MCHSSSLPRHAHLPAPTLEGPPSLVQNSHTTPPLPFSLSHKQSSSTPSNKASNCIMVEIEAGFEDPTTVDLSLPHKSTASSILKMSRSKEIIGTHNKSSDFSAGDAQQFENNSTGTKMVSLLTPCSDRKNCSDNKDQREFHRTTDNATGDHCQFTPVIPRVETSSLLSSNSEMHQIHDDKSPQQNRLLSCDSNSGSLDETINNSNDSLRMVSIFPSCNDRQISQDSGRDVMKLGSLLKTETCPLIPHKQIKETFRRKPSADSVIFLDDQLKSSKSNPLSSLCPPGSLDITDQNNGIELKSIRPFSTIM